LVWNSLDDSAKAQLLQLLHQAWCIISSSTFAYIISAVVIIFGVIAAYLYCRLLILKEELKRMKGQIDSIYDRLENIIKSLLAKDVDKWGFETVVNQLKRDIQLIIIALQKLEKEAKNNSCCGCDLFGWKSFYEEIVDAQYRAQSMDSRLTSILESLRTLPDDKFIDAMRGHGSDLKAVKKYNNK